MGAAIKNHRPYSISGVKALFRSGFARNVSVLAGGTVFAQGLTILALPILTRTYSPEEFGLLGVFTALLGMTSIIASLRYSIAIPLPELDQSAASLLAVALICVAVTTVAATVAILLFGEQISSLMNAPSLAKYLWLLPIAIAATGAYSVFQYWATRKKAFARIARTRVEQSIGGILTQLLMGWAGMGALGLIVGQVVSNGAGLFGLARRAFTEDRSALRGVCIAEMKTVARIYDRFPKYSTFEALTNSAGVQLPIILIASLSAGAEVGYLMISMRVMQAPMGLFGSSIAQVYFSRAVEEDRNGLLGNFTTRTIGALAKIGVGPLIFVGILAPSVFSLIFGDEWQRAGELVAWMTPWFVLQFLASPVSMVLHVKNKTHIALALNIYGLTLRLMFISVAFHSGFRHFLTEIFALASLLYYAAWLFYCFLISGASFKTTFVRKDFVAITLTWIGIALIAKGMFLS